MGTLFEQKPRDYCEYSTLDFIKNCQKIAKETNLTIDQVFTAMKVIELKRQNDLYVKNGDGWDEQTAGIGEILEDISNQIGNLKFEE